MIRVQAGIKVKRTGASILRDWLPSPFHIVTKGRIVFTSGDTSPQVDLLVLSPYYPKGLLSDKLYIAAGVLAAFECKRTLLRSHVRKAVENAMKISSLTRANSDTDYHIVYGLLAHSHRLPIKRVSPVDSVSRALIDADMELVKDPRDCLDFVCVPPIGTWSLMRMLFKGEDSELPSLMSSYMAPQVGYTGFGTEADALARFLTGLLRRFASFDKSIAQIAEYFQGADLFGTGSGQVRRWPHQEHSAGLRAVW